MHAFFSLSTFFNGSSHDLATARKSDHNIVDDVVDVDEVAALGLHEWSVSLPLWKQITASEFTSLAIPPDEADNEANNTIDEHAAVVAARYAECNFRVASSQAEGDTDHAGHGEKQHARSEAHLKPNDELVVDGS